MLNNFGLMQMNPLARIKKSNIAFGFIVLKEKSEDHNVWLLTIIRKSSGVWYRPQKIFGDRCPTMECLFTWKTGTNLPEVGDFANILAIIK